MHRIASGSPDHLKFSSSRLQPLKQQPPSRPSPKSTIAVAYLSFKLAPRFGFFCHTQCPAQLCESCTRMGIGFSILVQQVFAGIEQVAFCLGNLFCSLALLCSFAGTPGDTQRLS